ncbi:MAG: ABC transporter permease [Planctomycetes bacterium]|nr:ABC transporter permease [Planctomycetota bacterium]
MGQRFVRAFRRSVSGRVGLLLVAVFLVVAAGERRLAPWPPDQVSVERALLAPGPAHWLGTDDLGRDLLSRVLVGGRISLLIGVFSVLVAAALGVPLGLLAGYSGGFVDLAISRLVDVILAFPGILLAIALMAVLAPRQGDFTLEQGVANLTLAVAVVNLPAYVRQVRASAIGLRELEFVTASRALGAGTFHILFRVLLPNCLSPILVLATLGIGTAVLEAAALGFVGLGIPPGTPEWGTLLAENRSLFREAWWTVVGPGLAVSLTVLGFNLLGDGLRDALDPHTSSSSGGAGGAGAGRQELP